MISSVAILNNFVKQLHAVCSNKTDNISLSLPAYQSKTDHNLNEVFITELPRLY